MANIPSRAWPSKHRSAYPCQLVPDSLQLKMILLLSTYPKSRTYKPDLCFDINVNTHTHTYSHSVHSAISVPSTSSVWMIPSRLFPLLTAFTQQLCSPSVKCVSVPSSTNSPCRCKSDQHVSSGAGLYADQWRHQGGPWGTTATLIQSLGNPGYFL